MTPKDIAIIGAGPAGLASALYLHRAGHRVTILERFAAAAPVGSGLMLQPTGLSVLADLGLGNAIMALGQRIDRLYGTDAKSGRMVLDVKYGKKSEGGRHGLAVNRAALFNVLYEAVMADGITLKTDCDIADATPSSRGYKLMGQEFDLIIDCSGSRSKLRHLCHHPKKQWRSAE